MKTYEIQFSEETVQFYTILVKATSISEAKEIFFRDSLCNEGTVDSELFNEFVINNIIEVE